MKRPVVQKHLTRFLVAGFGLWSDFATEPIDCNDLWSNNSQDMATNARAMPLDLLYNSFVREQ